LAEITDWAEATKLAAPATAATPKAKRARDFMGLPSLRSSSSTYAVSMGYGELY
jgi:hypothetical protein